MTALRDTTGYQTAVCFCKVCNCPVCNCPMQTLPHESETGNRFQCVVTDTLHQGRRDRRPGLNAVDIATQWRSEWRLSASGACCRSQAMLHQLPFRILGFYCVNGSEFIKHKVAALLNKVLVEFAKSRAYRTIGDAAVDSKSRTVRAGISEIDRSAHTTPRKCRDSLPPVSILA